MHDAAQCGVTATVAQLLLHPYGRAFTPCWLLQGIIANETLAYFIGRTWLFFIKVGIDPARMRFRQHLQHEVSWGHLGLRRLTKLFSKAKFLG